MQITEGRREVKGKGEGEIYPFDCRVPSYLMGDKKAFLREQCKEIQENNKMGKARDLFKIIGEIKETFHARIGPIKDKNGKDLTEVDDIKKRWQNT